MDGHQDCSGVLRHLGQGLHQTVGRERVQTGSWFVQEQNTYNMESKRVPMSFVNLVISRALLCFVFDKLILACI